MKLTKLKPNANILDLEGNVIDSPNISYVWGANGTVQSVAHPLTYREILVSALRKLKTTTKAETIARYKVATKIAQSIAKEEIVVDEKEFELIQKAVDTLDIEYQGGFAQMVEEANAEEAETTEETNG